MDIFKLSKSLDELIYDVMMWIIFYPYTLIRVILWPGTMMDYVDGELRKDAEADSFDHGLSPPLFLFLSIILGWLLAPDITATLANIQTTAIGKALTESSWNLLLFRLLVYCSFPLAGAALYEWRTPGGITRGSFRKPFFQQAYLGGPLALALSYGFVLMSQGELRAELMTLLIIAALIWYLWAQWIFFRRTLGSERWAAMGWAILSLAIGLSIFRLSFLLV